ncbi:MAG: bifunctional N(6)-L-threonylcarbamoyladenine synthase/serine/threonine protein kinase [Candidatus Aenigmarchaeota archaeon]|nr:bifunctional N(6)-L-threonylcarbamoyladenine synthase/serine/threonine protein kinase [Candidatus Aenigmarchaeota archaeon]
MICLGIEATAHTFGIGICDDKGKVLANERSIYKPKAGWGIIPMDAGKHHEEAKHSVLSAALEKANLKIEDIGLIAYSRGPGLPPCLHKGAELAKELAEKHSVPLVPVNHCIAHIEIGRLTCGFENPVVVYVSGGNTQIISFAEGKYRVFGECMDIGVGNALDKFGREVGLDFPQAPKIEQLAKNGKWTELPYVVKGMDLSFSGIVTECIRKHQKGEPLEDICYSMQEVFFSMLTEVTERALAHLGKDQVLLTGGVAANMRLQEMLNKMCEERNARFKVVPREFAGDNGAMISWTGILANKPGQKIKPEDAGIDPRWRTDDVEISWLKN